MDMWTIGFTDRLRFPSFPSKLGKQGNARLRPHPPGATANKGIDVNDSKNSTVVPASALNTRGADLKTGRATP